MKESIVIVNDVIHQLCGSDVVNGYGLDEWSPPIHNLKALRQRLERIAENKELAQLLHNTGSLKFPTKIMVISHIESGRFGSLSEREADIISESVSFIRRKLQASA